MKNKRNIESSDKGWEVKKLSDIFNVKSSKRVMKSDWKDTGIPFYRAREIVKLAEDGIVDNELFISEELFDEFTKDNGYPKTDDILLSAVGTLGKVYIVQDSDKFYFKDASVLWLEKTNEFVSSKYIEYCFKSDFLKQQIIKSSPGATVGTLTISKTRNLKVPLPPLFEQNRIVSKLDFLFAEIDASLALIDQNIAQAEALKLSALDEEFGKIKSQENTKSIFIGDKDYLELIMGQSPPSKYYNTDKIGLPFYQGKKEFGELYPTPAVWCSKPNKIAEKGDILLSVRAPVGPTNLAKEKCCIGRGLAALRPNSSVLLTKFILYHLKNFELEIISKGQGSTFSSISGKNLRKIEIAFPELEEQQKVIMKLDSLFAEIDALVSDYQEKRANLEALKSSLLDSAFKGEL